MPTGQYERKPRVERVTLKCEGCGNEIVLAPGVYRQRIKRAPIRFCSRACMGAAQRKPESYVDVTCAICGKVFAKRRDHVATSERHYCSPACAHQGQIVPGARWRDRQAIKEYMRDYVQTHRDEHNARVRRWGHGHAAERAALAAARRAKAKAGVFSAEDWTRLKEKYGHRCLSCNRQEPEVRLEIDHVVPLAAGGAHTLDNLQPLCRTCNATKGTRTIDYRPGVAGRLAVDYADE